MDLEPETLDKILAGSMHYDQATTTQTVTGPSFGPNDQTVSLINIRDLASSLQAELPSILSPAARTRVRAGTHYFHVEAGITMADLDQLLDHQKPRLAIQSSGGSPGATLAGTLSTATHGGEFRWPLLVDTVRAIHLVGPGGEEWWIEGEQSIADQTSLQKVYPKLDPGHFIGGRWRGIPGLAAQDVLNAVIVSMGTMGVIYSVVLEVVPQFGLRQIVKATNWANILAMAKTTQGALANNDPNANHAVLNVVLDGALNGTGIAETDNVYADLAINPFTQDCWITNREVTPNLPLDSNNPAVSFNAYFSAISDSLSSHAQHTVENSPLVGRIFDFFGWATEVPSRNLSDDVNDVNQAAALAQFVTKFPDVLTAVLATINVQAVANVTNASSHPDRGQQFLGDLLTGILHAIQGTGEMQYQFGDLSHCPFWAGNFKGGAGNQILFYQPFDGSWWLGTFSGGSIRWGLASNTKSGTNQFGDLSHCLFWAGNFKGGAGEQILFYQPFDGSWWLGTFGGGSINWGLASNTKSGTNQFGDLSHCLFWAGNFKGGAGEQILFYQPFDGSWWLGTFSGDSISWGLASNTKSGTNQFGDLSHCLFWAGNFKGGAGEQILFYQPFDGSWWLGTFNGGSIRWGLASNTASGTNQFGNLSHCLFWAGNFKGGAGDQILFYQPFDGSWWLGTFSGDSISWGLASNTKSGTNQFGDLSHCLFWAGDFKGGAGDQILFYQPFDGSWWLGTFNGGSIRWGLASNTASGANQFGDLSHCLFWARNFKGGAGNQILFYQPFDGSWWLGTFSGDSIRWGLASNTKSGTNTNSDRTDIAYKVGAIGWPNSGIPGRGLEIALDPSKAFSFLQNILFNDILKNNMVGQNKPLIGYISIRVCPTTSTLMGMQQFSPFSVMIEIVGYRSPESDVLMDTIQQRVLALNSKNGLGALLHWGLENNQMTTVDLMNTPLNNPVHPGSQLTKIGTFKAIRQLFLNQHLPCFDNNFTRRLGL